jgi:hypothetical protein
MTQQPTIINQIKDIEVKSGVAFEIDVTQLVSLAERGRAITSVNDDNFAVVKKEMQQTRKYVKDYMLDARSEFNRLAKGVIEVERIILTEVVIEEDRLIALDKAEKERLLKEARLEALPAKRERITAVGIEFTDEEVLAMTDVDFELEFATRLSAKAVAEQIAAEAKLAEDRAALEAEKVELARKEAENNRIEQARKEERERAEQLVKDTAEREAKAEIEAKRVADEAKLKRLADEKYQAFLTENMFNKDTDIIIENNKIYRFVAEYMANE